MEEENKKSKVGGEGGGEGERGEGGQRPGEKRQMMELTGKRKIQNKREKVEEVCTPMYILLRLKRRTDC